jgi:hypothetical protein
MAQTDLAGLLTGITQAPIDPMAGASMAQRQLAFGAEAGRNMRQGMGGLFGADTRTTKEKADQMMAKLDVTKKADRDQMLKIVGNVNPQAVPSLRAKFAQMDKEQGLLDTQKSSDKETRQSIADQVRGAGYSKMADAIIKEAGSGSELALKGGIKVLTNMAQPAKPAPKMHLTPEEELIIFREQESFKADLDIAQEAEKTATEQSAQYLPILQQMQSLTETVDFGVGSTAIASINNTLHSLASKAGLNPEPVGPETDATATYNSLSKRLKAWLLEAQKGAISNLENKEITKNTANPDMTKNQAQALVNFSEASLMSSNNKAQEQKQWLRDNGTLIGFEKAWGKYIEDFPRTEGFLTMTDPDGKRKSVQANFKPIKSNMELFSLYASNKGKPPTFVKEGKGFTIEDIKKELIQDRLDEMKLGNPDFKPTKEQLSLYELNARRKIGSLISLRLNNGTYTVAK